MAGVVMNQLPAQVFISSFILYEKANFSENDETFLSIQTIHLAQSCLAY